MKFYAPVPGYDPGILPSLQYFGIEMINVTHDPEGTGYGYGRKLVSEDAAIKGIWCVCLSIPILKGHYLF